MKLFFLIISLFAALTSFAAGKKETPLIVSDIFITNSILQPDNILAEFHIQHSSDAQPSSDVLKQVSAVMQKNAASCTFSDFVFSVADSAYSDFTCRFKDSASYNLSYSQMSKLVSGQEYTVTLKQIKWIFSEQSVLNRFTEMKLSAARQVLSYSKTYAKTLGTYCKVKDISFEASEGAPLSKKQAETDKSEMKLILETGFKLICR